MILAIDPGSTHSGYALIIPSSRRPVEAGKISNADMLDVIAASRHQHLAVEMIASYGMAVGADVFATCVWIGRFQQHNEQCQPPATCQLVYRRDVKLHHCHSAKAKDSNIAQALRDRFAPSVSNYGKGTKAEPGFFYGFAKDAWQAFALAVYVADTRGGGKVAWPDGTGAGT